MELTVLIAAFNEAENLTKRLPGRVRRLEHITPSLWEVIVVDGGSKDRTVQVAEKNGAQVVDQQLPGYGGAIRAGIDAARGKYILTMDADLSHEPNFVYKLWSNRCKAEIVIASRYCRAGAAYMPWIRKLLSRILNIFFCRGLSLGVRDLSSGFRIYQADFLKSINLQGKNFEILEEIVIKAIISGGLIKEIPFTYFPRDKGSTHASVIKFGLDYLRTFGRMWKLRNSIEAADYDERAFYSIVLPQRWWQRSRHKIITTAARASELVIDIGCGSSVILQSLNRVVGLDISFPKMRYMRRFEIPVVNGSVFSLPFSNKSADCVICSEVIEHIPMDPAVFVELDRILRPGGLLILGTPDYGTWRWPVIEWLYGVLMPGGYADEHISRYSFDRLALVLSAMGYKILDQKYIFGSELIVVAQRPERLSETDRFEIELSRVMSSWK